MHQSVLDFLGRTLTPEEISGKSVLEVGSYDVNGTPRSIVEPMCPASYIGVDSQPGPGVDRVVNVDNLDVRFGTRRFDVVISTEMLEHVKDWRTAVFQMKSVTKSGGLLVVTTRSPGFPYHAFPEDHWRFTGDHFRAIFADMDILALEPDVYSHPGVFLKAQRRAVGKLLSIEDLSHVEPAGPG